MITKLYGGTKEEMQRLLEDASKISGIEYDISSFADVTEAIHVMQTELGITGTTAKEASTTIQGSANAMKASWKNLLTGMADPTQDFDALLQNFISSIGTFAGNLLPVIQTATQGVLQMVQGLLPQFVQGIFSLLPGLLESVANLITQISLALPSMVQSIVTALPIVIQTIVSALPEMIPALIDGIVQSIVILVAALPQIIQPIIDNLPMIITLITSALISNFPIILQSAIKLVASLVSALPQIIKALIDSMGMVAVQIGEALLKALPAPIKNAFSKAFDDIKVIWDKVQPYFSSVWEGIKDVFSVVGAVLGGFFEVAWTAIQEVWNVVTSYFEAIWDTIAGIFSVVASVLSGNWQDAWNAIKGIVDSWVDYFQSIWDGIKNIFSSVGSWFSNIFSVAWQGIKNAWSNVLGFFSGIWNGIVGVFSGVGSWFSQKFSDAVSGIKNAWSNVTSFFSNIWVSIKNVFSSAVSSFSQIGKNMVNGLWNGIQNAKNWLLSNIKSWCGSVLNGIKAFFGIHSPSTVMRDEVGKMIPKGMAIGIDKAKNLVTKATKALVTDTRSEVQKVLDDMNEEMLESEKLYAEESIRLKDSTSEADKEYLENLKENAEKERKIYDARQKDIKNAQNNIIDAYEGAANDILDSIEDLQERQKDLADKLFDFGDLMEEVSEIEDRFSDVHSVITKAGNGYNLAKIKLQTRDLEKYYDVMIKIRDRYGMIPELFDVIKNMSYEESFAYAKKLMEMSDKQFETYITDWQKKQETSKRITEELFGDDSEYLGPRRILSDLQQQTNVLSDYYSLLNQVKERAEVPEDFFASLRDMGVEEGLEYANALLELSDEDFANYIKAWEEKQKTSQLISKELYKDEAEQLATEIRDKFEEVGKEFFGVGKNAADQFENGFIEQLKTVVSNIKGAISGAFSNVGLGISPDYIVGGYSINVPALATGSILPSGTKFQEILNGQQREQKNVEVPLSTIVDAMNIALGNRGSSEVVKEEHYHLGETELMTVLHKLVKGGERLQGKSLISGGAY